MGFVHSTQIQNKSHPHPHLPDAIASTGFAPIRCCCNLPSKAPSSKWLPSGHKSPISTLTMLQTEPLTSQTTMSPPFLKRL